MIAAIKSLYPKYFDQRTEGVEKTRAVTIAFEDTARPEGGFDGKWESYLLPCKSSARDFQEEQPPEPKFQKIRTSRRRSSQEKPATISEVIADSRDKISKITGTPIESVKITVSLGD